MKLMGYQRENGHFGVRNHVLIIPTSVCATDTAEKIAAQVPGAIAIPNQHGCCQIGSDLALTQQTIVGFGKNANVGACVVVGLGCDGIQARAVAEEIRTTGKRVEVVVIQEEGGTLPAIAKGALYAARDLSMQKRVEFDMSEIIMALECGGSDPTSGLASNPSIGYCSNRLIAEGGSSILSETTEVIGAEHLLAARFEDEDQKQKFLDMVKNVENRAIALGEDLRSGQPTPGNKEGGLSTIEEKSLGCMYKAGTAPFKGALNYAELLPLEKKGLYFMDTPGQDIDSITGMVAGGAQVVIFSTGRGTPFSAPAPTLKISTNTPLAEKKAGWIDFNTGVIADGEKTIDEAAKDLLDLVIRVASGEQTKAEKHGFREISIFKDGVVL